MDASMAIVLIGDDPRRTSAEAKLREWIATGEALHAPELLSYEVANGLTRLMAAGMFPADRLDEAWNALSRLPITYHPLRDSGADVARMGLQLRRTSAYDAPYLVLARELGAEPWTFDGPLARNAQTFGFPVRLLTG